MNIYSLKPAPYVYMCVHKITGHFYIGYREANTLVSHLDFPLYKTSCPKIKTNFEQYDWTIIAEFFDENSAYEFEQQLIYENWNNPLILNESCYFNKRKFKYTKPSLGMLNKNHTEETKIKMSKSHSNKTFSDTHKNNISKSLIGHTHTEETKKKIRETKKNNRICRIRDRKEMDIGNFHRYP